MNILPVRVINGNLQAYNGFITEGRQKTFLNASADSSDTTITVFSISGFSKGNFYAQIGDFGAGNMEIVKMHASTAPTGNTITLASGLVNNHDANEPVYFVNYNQVEFSRATTTSGTKTVLITQDINTNNWSIYSDVTNSTGYAFARFKNEAGTTYSAYSAPAPYANASFNTAEFIMNEALRETKKELNDVLTPDYLREQMNECLRDMRKGRNKFSWTQSFNTIIGQTVQGAFRFSMPDDIYDKYSPKAIEQLYLGGRPRLTYVDPNYFFNVVMRDVHWTQVRTGASAGDTELAIDNSYDFSDTGSITVGEQTIIYEDITRADVADATAEFTDIPGAGETGAITASITADDFVFQDESSSEPIYWTLFNGFIYIYNLPDSTWDDYNLYADYYKVITEIDSLDDAIDYIQYDLIKNWLKWKIRAMEKNDGVENLDDPSYLLYREQLNTLIKKDRTPNKDFFRNVYEVGEHEDQRNPRGLRDGTFL